MSMEKILASCIFCKEVRSAHGIFTHVDRSHLKLQKYSNGRNNSYHLFSKAAEEKYLKLGKKCLNCQSVLDFSKKNQKFCNRSCSAQYTNARKDYSKIKTGPEKRKHLISKHCFQCQISFETFDKNKRFCSRQCSIVYKNVPFREKRSEWQNYRADCQFRFNIKNYPEEFDFNLIKEHGWYKASNRGNNLKGVSRDHMVSCKYGFENNLPIEHIRHPANCKLVIHTENISKHKKNSISYEELLIRIEKWNSKYGSIAG